MLDYTRVMDISKPIVRIYKVRLMLEEDDLINALKSEYVFINELGRFKTPRKQILRYLSSDSYGLLDFNLEEV
jgi:hypothetical protein